MKKMLTACCLLSVFAYGDEIERINTLVKEVTSLRLGFEKCEEELKLCKFSSKPPKKDVEKRASAKKLATMRRAEKKKIKELSTQIKMLEKQIQSLKERLASKSKETLKLRQEIETLKKETNKKKRVQNEKLKKLKESKNCTDDNQTSPVVILQQKHKQTHLDLDENGRVLVKENFKIVITHPKTFRTLKKAPVYDKPNGKKIDTWEKGRSFTSYKESGEWIKITGYFVDRKWTKAKKEMWIKKSDAFERD